MSTKECAVCCGISNGFHFGVEVCSACSAFFRRVVIKNRKFRCWGANLEDCEIQAGISPLCKSCRFTKCLAVGMKPEIVQKGREMYGKRLKCNEIVPSPSSSTLQSDKSTFPILETILETYSKVEKIRVGMHQSKNENFFDEILHKSFYLQFMLLESGFWSCQHKKSNVRYLPSGDFIDCAKPETYFCDPEGSGEMRTTEVIKLFAPSCQIYRRNVTCPMLRENTDRFEFLALTGLALFDADLDLISDQTAMTCRRNRERIQREMLKYYKSTKSLEEAGLRLANIVSIIPTLQRAARLFVVNLELKYMMNTFWVDQQFYDNCMPKYITPR